MSTRLVVDNQSELRELEIKETPQQHPSTKTVANIISYLFHPVFIPIYVMLFLIYVHPFLFVGVSFRDKILTLVQSLLMYTFFPVVTVLLLKGLGFLSSLHLRTQRERIIPLLACMTWSFWMWHVWRNLPGSPDEIIIFSLAVFIAIIMAWLMNIYFKVSLHAISTGVAVAFMFFLAFSGGISLGVYLSLALLFAGLVCTARFIVSNHSAFEIYSGFAAGILALLIALWVG